MIKVEASAAVAVSVVVAVTLVVIVWMLLGSGARTEEVIGFLKEFVQVIATSLRQ